MSFKALDWARSVKTGSSTRKAVLRAIAEYADAEGKAWPSQARLAEDTEFTVRGVRKAIIELEGMGLISREEQRRKDGTQAADIIFLNFAWVDSRNVVPPADEQAEPYSRQAERHSPQPEQGSAPTTFEPPSNLHQEPEVTPTPSAMPALRPGESYLPADWQPDDQDIRAAIDAGLKPENIPHEAAQFRDRMLSRGIASFDWRAAWRSWCRSPYRKGGELDTGQYRRRAPSPTYPRPANSRDLWARTARQAHENLTRTSDDQQQGGFDDEDGAAGAGEPGARGHGGPVRERPRGQLVRLSAYGDPGRRRAVG